jgi:hypothetical protein
MSRNVTGGAAGVNVAATRFEVQSDAPAALGSRFRVQRSRLGRGTLNLEL